MTEKKTETDSRPPSAVACKDLLPCPFCEAVPIPHAENEYKVFHDSKCFIAMTYKNAGWLCGERAIRAWMKRAG